MERIKEESKDCVTCPICMEIFDDPRTLQCSHTFCFHCLIELRGSHDSSEYKLCPTCRRNSVPPLNQIERLPKNEFALSLASLIHDYEKTDTPIGKKRIFYRLKHYQAFLIKYSVGFLLYTYLF